MKVEIINPEVLTNLYKNHGEFACVCYNTPPSKAESVGKSCQASGHLSGSRCEYIKFRITDIDRGTAEQCLRHELGTYVPFELQDNYTFADYSEVVKDVSPDQIIKNMASFRYINKEGFNWATPPLIGNSERAKDMYNTLMNTINVIRSSIIDVLVEEGCDPHAANQDANFVLPRATTTEFVIGFTPEALIHFEHKRLCYRAQEFIRELAMKIRTEVKKYSERYAAELQPQCMHLMWCPEGKHQCEHRCMPTKEELRQLITMSRGST